MMDERTRLMQWQPGAPGYTQDDIIFSIGVQCRDRKFKLADVLAWLGNPERAWGNSGAGQLAYFFHSGQTFAMFDVKEGLVVEFGTVERFKANAIRLGPAGQRILYNVLDEMPVFEASSFK